MDSMEVPIELRCGKCGQKTLEASGDELTDDSVVTCTSCGQTIGKWVDVKEHALQQSAEQVKQRLTDVFGNAFKPR